MEVVALMIPYIKLLPHIFRLEVSVQAEQVHTMEKKSFDEFSHEKKCTEANDTIRHPLRYPNVKKGLELVKENNEVVQKCTTSLLLF